VCVCVCLVSLDTITEMVKLMWNLVTMIKKCSEWQRGRNKVFYLL